MTDYPDPTPCQVEVRRGNDLWFEPAGRESMQEKADRQAAAAAICHTCAWIEACARAAADLPAHMRWGTWAGVDFHPIRRPLGKDMAAKRERDRATNAERQRRKRAKQPCGTSAAYSRHLYHDEQPCQPCVDAKHAADREYQRRRKAEREALT